MPKFRVLVIAQVLAHIQPKAGNMNRNLKRTEVVNRILWLVPMVAVCAMLGCNGKQVADSSQEETKVVDQSSGANDSANNSTTASAIDERFAVATTQEENDQRAAKIAAEITATLESSLAELKRKVEAGEGQQLANPVHVFIGDALKTIEAYPKSPAAFDVALSGLAYAKGPSRNQFMDYLLTEWPQKLDHQKIASYLLKQVPDQSIENFLRKSIANAPQGAGQARSMLAFKEYFDQMPFFSDTVRKSEGLVEKLPASQIEYIHTPRSPEQTREIEGYLQQVIDNYADLKYQGGGMTDYKTYGEVATHGLYELKNLNVGDVAPEISGEDLDGVAFNLSDYRGKVVLLDFWGHWCPPCRRMYPHERKFVQELSGLPFALIGVNSDRDIETAREAVLDDPLPWRNFWNGPLGRSGPISKQWNISAWPTFYLIDGKGVIRYKGVLGDDIRVAIETLMEETGHVVELTPVNMASR